LNAGLSQEPSLNGVEDFADKEGAIQLKKERFSAEQILGELKQAEANVARGCRQTRTLRLDRIGHH